MSSGEEDHTISDSITQWKEQSNQAAAQTIYERCIGRLVRRAKALLGDAPRRVADEEDVAARAINGLFEGIREGRFPQLKDRHDLWQVLMMLVRRRAVDHLRKYGRPSERRQDGSVAGRGQGASPPQAELIDWLRDEGPTPEEALELADALRRRLAQLPTARARHIALCKLAGYTNDEIAGFLECTTRTVEYALGEIRKTWEEAT